MQIHVTFLGVVLECATPSLSFCSWRLVGVEPSVVEVGAHGVVVPLQRGVDVGESSIGTLLPGMGVLNMPIQRIGDVLGLHLQTTHSLGKSIDSTFIGGL